MAFSQLSLHPSLLRGLKDLGFTRPTAIQADAIPPAMQGRDLLACAMTGSGKTAAFLLPILHKLIDERRGFWRRARRHLDDVRQSMRRIARIGAFRCFRPGLVYYSNERVEQLPDHGAVTAFLKRDEASAFLAEAEKLIVR